MKCRIKTAIPGLRSRRENIEAARADALQISATSLRSRRENKAWGENPREQAHDNCSPRSGRQPRRMIGDFYPCVISAHPTLSPAARAEFNVGHRRLGFRSRFTPGFILAPAPQAKRLRRRRLGMTAMMIASLLLAFTASVAAQSNFQAMIADKSDNSPAATTAPAPKPESARFLNPVEGMSVEDAVKYALANNKNLTADRLLIAQAAGRLKQAALKPNPMLEISGSSDPTDVTQSNYAVGFTLPLELRGRRARRIEVAERELARLKFEVAERERRLAAEVRMKYGEVVEAARNLELNERLLDLNQQSFTIIKARVTEGASAPLEQSLLQVELGRIEAQRTLYSTRAAVLIEELKNLLGLGPEEKFLAQDEFIERPVELTREQMLEQALQTRPDLQAARAAEAVAAAFIAQAKTEGRMDMSVFAEFGLQSNGFDQLGLNPDTGRPEPIVMRNGMIRGGVTITLPTRNKNQGNIEAAIALTEEARLRREFVESVVRREITAAYTRYQGATRVLKTYNNELLAASQNNLRIVRGSYDLGYVRLTEVLSEQRRLVDVQMNYTGALREYYSSRAELENALGASLGGK
jgi:cobalt-zinc-cadmium efflux system outer membrane protein